MSYSTLPANASLKFSKFTAQTPDEQIRKFKTLLSVSDLGPRTYENTTDDKYFGVKYDWMVDAKKRWEGGYDWRKTEARINSYPNYSVDITDEDGESYFVHFVALFSQKKDAVPITLLHGWPGSFLEFLWILDLFKEKYPVAAELPYHVVVPSLPGYGYSSGAPLNKNMHMSDQARIIDKLMVGLGFGKGYVSQGGDIGSFVSRMLVVAHPSCKAAHLNFNIMSAPPNISEDAVSQAELKGLGRLEDFGTRGNAYAREHGTRPATIGFVLSSSQLALLAWIGEKFQTWTEHDPPLDDILDSVTLYWFTQTFPRSIFPYRAMHENTHSNERWHIKAPKLFGYSWFPYELGPVPKAWVETTGNLVWYRQHTSGGHFAAMEKPKELLQDIEDFVAEVWPKVGGPKL